MPLTPEQAVDSNSVGPKSVEPEPDPKMNFVGKHWRGAFSLPRSFWVHGVLLGYLLLVMSCVLMEEIHLYPGSFFCMIGMIGIGFWQIGGVCASAKRQGGFWAKAAKFSIVWVLAVFRSSFSDTLTHELQSMTSHYGAKTETVGLRYNFFPVENGDNARIFVSMTGEILAGDHKRFTRYIASLPKNIRVVGYFLDSPGGNIYEALEIAETIRGKSLGTAVAPGAKCVSA
jgi:hypothetical protein